MEENLLQNISSVTESIPPAVAAELVDHYGHQHRAPEYTKQPVTYCTLVDTSSQQLLLHLHPWKSFAYPPKRCRDRNVFLQVVKYSDHIPSVCVACLTVITITMGLMSKDRMWLPFSDRNTVGWGLGFAATGGILTLLSIFCLIVDQIAHYSEQIYYKLLEEGGLPAVQSMPPDFTSGVGELPARTMPPGASAIGAASESKLGGVPSLFLTASLPSVAGSMESGGRHGGGGPAARISVLGSAKGALLTRYGETRTAIPGMSLRPEIPATSGALASAKLRQNLQCERPTEPASTAAAVGAQPSSYSARSLSLSRIGGKQEKPVIVYGTSQGNILKDSAV
ncbi:conserved hypothetical protein [Echinococcus multilocularis]|uniref:Uncharacterized protein n=1 Tax=Echinococcus multilocularis TaxID=6211 RepID=A0A068Y460_ECHMU|nr:conserved hypothetical protein [Echinococcus multilocularis]